MSQIKKQQQTNKQSCAKSNLFPQFPSCCLRHLETPIHESSYLWPAKHLSHVMPVSDAVRHQLGHTWSETWGDAATISWSAAVCCQHVAMPTGSPRRSSSIIEHDFATPQVWPFDSTHCLISLPSARQVAGQVGCLRWSREMRWVWSRISEETRAVSHCRTAPSLCLKKPFFDRMNSKTLT